MSRAEPGAPRSCVISRMVRRAACQADMAYQIRERTFSCAVLAWTSCGRKTSRQHHAEPNFWRLILASPRRLFAHCIDQSRLHEFKGKGQFGSLT